jgi:hypothetical protein
MVHCCQSWEWSFAHFHAVTVKCHTVVCRINCLACQDKFFVNNPLEAKENDDLAVDFSLHLSRLFQSRWIWTFGVWLMFYSLNTWLIIIRVSIILFRYLHKIWCCSFVGSIVKLHHTQLQIKGRKNQHIHAAVWNFVNWLPRYDSTCMYRCIALLQLPWRWQHLSLKLWMTVVCLLLYGILHSQHNRM